MDALNRSGRLLWGLFGSLRTSCVLLLALGLLTWLGTLAQADNGLYDARRKYFESWYFVEQLGPLPLPLPGAVPVLSALALNLVVGGLLRLRRARATLGVWITHAGVLLLFGGGFVEWRGAHSGHLTLYEGQQADWYQSYYDWELVLREHGAPGQAREHVLPHAELEQAAGEAVVRYESSELPFALELTGFAPNSRLAAATAGDPRRRLIALPGEREAEQNIGGLVALAHPRDGASSSALSLWGASAPLPLRVGGRDFELELRRERRPLPFTLALVDFEKVDHPRTGMPKSFASDVSIRAAGTERGQRIEMNEPLREGGLVVYQSGWGPQGMPAGTPLFSTFAVVRNPSDRLPIAACIVIAAGLLLHFSDKLRRQLRRAPTRALRPAVPLRVAAGIGALWVCASGAAAQAGTRGAWTPRTLELAAELPLQEGGRIQPLSTYASTTLLRLEGRKSHVGADGTPVDATAWLLDLLCDPLVAASEPVFLVQNPAALDALGVARGDKGRRARYSFDELRPGLERLLSLAHEYAAIEPRARSATETELVRLAENVISYGRLASALEFARLDEPRFHALLSARPPPAELLQPYLGVANDSELLALFAPLEPVADAPAWLSPRALAAAAAAGRAPAAEHVDGLRELEEFARAAGDPRQAEQVLERLHALCTRLAAARGEGARVPLEVAYHRFAPLHWSLCAFGIAFAALCASWLWPSARMPRMAAIAAACGGALLLVAAIALRCAIRGRPPVSTLYETVLFVTAAGTIVALCAAWLQRERVALAAGVVLGLGGLFIANGYEALDARDTMPSLVAVLDTNFWLATHVTAITLGYAAGMLAALTGSLYALGRLCGERVLGADSARALERTTYGVLCFGLLFTLVGTILGGIWANESWGRFWGWDPKENGALLIVISQIAMLHGRMAGWLREPGLCVAAAAGGIVVAFSWWGVNLLGVGLHSYGFTSGIQRALWTYYGLQAAIVLCGCWAIRRHPGSRSRVPHADQLPV